MSIRNKVSAGLLSTGILSLVIVAGAWVNFINHTDFHWQIPFRAFVITSPKTHAVEVVRVVEAEVKPDPLNPLQRYICDKFGEACKTALAISMAESHQRPDALNKNKNGSYDVGVFQVNSVHFTKCSLAQLADARGNVDCAYELYKTQGWTPWATYNDKSYKKYLN